MQPPKQKILIKALVNNWYEEKNSAQLYTYLSQHERDPITKPLFLHLAQMAKEQAMIWAKQLDAYGMPPPVYQINVRTRIIMWLIRLFGAQTIKPFLAAMKVRGLSVYLGKMPGHTARHLDGKIIEQQHQAIHHGSNIRAAIFGINDGLISNASLILGISGASNDTDLIILTGIAGLFAGAFSMASGEYVSMHSQRSLFEYQIALEKAELDAYPEEEAKELSYIYQARGLTKEEADLFANKMLANQDEALNTLAREELGINPNDLGSPISAAIASFLAFSLGGFIPLIPFFILSANQLISAIMLTGVALFSVGLVLSLYTGRHGMASGLRMLIIGAAAGLLTYLIGHFVGINL